jgi:hypothetical protein
LLDLDRSRGVGVLLRDAFATWLRHLPVFLVMALLVVVPITGLVDGLWTKSLDADGGNDDFSFAPAAASLLLQALVVPALVTAMHVAAVVDLGAGRRPAIARSLRVAVRTFPTVVATLLLWVLGFFVGSLFLVVPGVYVYVVFFFGPQAAVVDRVDSGVALSRSAAAVRGHWWRTFVIVVALFPLTYAIARLCWALAGVIAPDTDAASIATGLAVQALVLSFTALVTTLLFFDLRARKVA